MTQQLQPGDRIRVVCSSCGWSQPYQVREPDTERPRRFCCNRCGSQEQVEGQEKDQLAHDQLAQLPENNPDGRSTTFTEANQYLDCQRGGPAP